jgi:hypothetical protein
VNAKQFQRYLVRDGGCVHCGELDAVSPHHRLNRGMGGSKTRDVPSNLIVICSSLNFLMEANSYWAETARQKGWKLRNGENPLDVPVWHYTRGWVMLDDEFKVRETGPDGWNPARF